MAQCIDVMAAAMRAASSGAVGIPPRVFHAFGGEGASLGLMPGFAPELKSYGAKVISLHPQNPNASLPAIQGFVALFDYATGKAIAIIEGAEITGLRTAAASGLATDLLAREDARSCGIFGTGLQAQTHIDAMCAVRPIEKVLVWGRDNYRARRFAEAQTQRLDLPVLATSERAEVAECDIICTVTGASEPLLLGRWVRPGAHVNLVGAHKLTTREADTALVVRAQVYVDLLQSVRDEGGDIMIPVAEGAIAEDHIIGEIGQLLAGSIVGRTGADQVTLYNSLGITAQDLYAAHAVYERALAAGAGDEVAF